MIDGIKHGFNILDEPHDNIVAAEVHNYKSATNNDIKDKVEQQIKSEIAQGNYVITQTKPTIISALGAIPKKDSNDVRLIHDCSRPAGVSVNSYATCEHYAYETVERACKLIKPGAFMAKVDLKSAYRHVPIHPSNYAATGLKWTFSGDSQATYLIDTKLPFGASRSPGIFHRVTQSVTRMMLRRNMTTLAYLDDFLIIADTESDCWKAYEELVTLLQNLGFSINWNKVTTPTQSLTYLGIEINSVSRQLILPDSKIQEIKSALQAASQRSKMTKREMQSLAGKLNFAARVVYGGRTFLRRIIDSINTLKRPHHHKRITQSMRKDLQWWIDFMDSFNGVTFFVDSEPTQIEQFSTDACLNGGAAHFHTDWFYSNWEIDYPHLKDAHINKLELFTILLSLRRWHTSMKNKWIVVYTDNMSTMYAINKGTIRCNTSMAWLREMFWITARNNFRLTARYLTSKANKIADTLSRLHDRNVTNTLNEMITMETIKISPPRNNITTNALSSLPPQHIQLLLKNVS